MRPPLRNLRLNCVKKNRIRTIKSTLAIEGHSFDETQITAVLEKKRVIGTTKEVIEVQNTLCLYEAMGQLKSYKVKDFLRAHKNFNERTVVGCRTLSR